MSVGPATPDTVRAIEQRYRRRKHRHTRTALLAWAFLAACTLASARITGLYPTVLIDGASRVADYLIDIAPHLEADLLLADRWTEGSLAYWYFNLDRYLSLLLQTINMALVATLIATAGAGALSFAASRNLVRSRIVGGLMRRCFEVFRSIPDLVFALLFVWAFGVGPLAGVLAMTCHSFGVLGKLFAEANESAVHGPVQAVRSTGAHWLHEVRFGVLPQSLPAFASYSLLRLESNVRHSSVIGIVGGGGIGQELYYVINFNFYEEVSAIVLLIILTVVAIDLASERIRGALIGQREAVA